MAGIVRRFGSTVALGGVGFEVAAGEVHALLGENGAGKTTLMRVLAGLDRPDEGMVVVGGRRVTRFEPRTLRDLGVAMVQQHFTLVPTLTAGDNLALARPEGRIRPGARAAAERVERLADTYGLAVRTDVPAERLSVGERQRLEILRALDADARLLILDEPTAVLSDAEAGRLVAVCRRLAAEGRAVIVITHRLGEVFAGCDRVTVLRGGAVALAGVPVGDHDKAGLASLMVGADVAGAPGRGVDASGPPRSGPPRSGPPKSGRSESGRSESGRSNLGPHESVPPGSAPPGSAPPRLRVTAASLGRLTGADLEVRAGEIVGIAGVDGNGQAELEALLAGLNGPDGGQVTVEGKPMPVGDPRARVAAGIAYIPSDRYQRGLARTLSLADNLELGRGPRIRPARRRRGRAAVPLLGRWDVRTAGPEATAASLSGGNAQKLVLARELGTHPHVVIAAYPTRGLDPGAARTIADRVIGTAAQGAAVVWFGAELDELFALADRIVVLAGGRTTESFAPPYDRVAIGLAMAGSAAGAEPGSMAGSDRP